MAMNAAFRISQNASRSTTHKISHVLSGSTRSLSWTSNQASRASVARNTAAYTVIHSQYLNHQAGQWAKGFSTSAIVEEESSSSSGSTVGKVTDAIREREQEGGAVEERPYGDRSRYRTPNREYLPSRTVFVGGIPFFATEEDLRRVFEAAAPVDEIRFGQGKVTHNAPFAHVTFKNFDDAVAVVESAKQEPFYMEGRKVHIAYSQKKPKYGPSQRLFFDNFVGGNLVALRNFLGEHAVAVDNAYFSRDQETGDYKTCGIIQFHTIEQASKAREALSQRPGPDGSPVYLRFTNDRKPDGSSKNVPSRDRRNNRKRDDNDGESSNQE